MIVRLEDGSVVSVSAAVGQMMIDSGRAELYVPPVFDTETLTVGENEDYPDIESAWMALAERRLDKETTIQVLDGEYTVEGLLLDHHPDAHRIQILGNLTDPAACKLNCGGGGLFFNRLRGLEFSGFSVAGTSETTRQGITLDVQSEIHSAPNSLLISNCKNGLTVLGRSIYQGLGVIIVDCDEAVSVKDASAEVEKLVVTGLAGTSQSGIVAVDGAVVDADEASVKDVRYGMRAQNGGVVNCHQALVEDCYVGYFAELGGVIANNEGGIARRCEYGFAAQRKASISAYKALADACRYGFVAYYAAQLYASESAAVNSEVYGYSVYGGSLLEAWQTSSNADDNWRDYRLSSGSVGAANSLLFYS